MSDTVQSFFGLPIMGWDARRLRVAEYFQTGPNATVKLDGDIEMKGDLLVTGQISYPSIQVLNVPSDYPTIQQAIDAFGGRTGVNGTINVAPGVYVENLCVDNFTSNSGPLTYQGCSSLSIVGDTRHIVGVSYPHGGVCMNPSYDDNLGGNYADVTLSNVDNVITVTTNYGTPDFVAAGVVPGDELRVFDSFLDWYRVTILSVSGNTITHDGGNIIVGNSGDDSSITFLPNVTILPKHEFSNTMQVINTGLNMQGVHFDVNPDLGSAYNVLSYLVLESNASVIIENCVFDDSWYYLWDSSVYVSNGSKLGARTGNYDNYEQYPNSFLGSGHNCVTLLNNASLSDGYWFMTSPSNTSIYLNQNSNVDIYDQFQSRNNLIGVHIDNCSYANLGIIFIQDAQFCTYVTNGSKLTLGANDDCFTYNCGIAINCSDTSSADVRSWLYVDYCYLGLLIRSNSTINMHSYNHIIVTDYDFTEVLTDETSKLLCTQNNVQSSENSFYMGNGVLTYYNWDYFRGFAPVQSFDSSSGNISVFIYPSFEGPYVNELSGKIFTMYLENTGSYSQCALIIGTSNQFLGFGGNGNCVAIFNNPGDSLTFTVTNNGDLQVLSMSGITWDC